MADTLGSVTLFLYLSQPSMSVLSQVKCYLSCALIAWFVYYIKTECPLNKPLPFDTEGVNEICLHSHKAYGYVRPYSEPIVHQVVEYYNASPIKPYVEEYYPVVEGQALNVYNFVSEKVDKLVERLNDNSLSNEKKIVIPTEYDAFTKKVGESATTPDDDLIEATPEPTGVVSNYVPETEDEPEIIDPTAIPKATDSTKSDDDDAPVEDSKLEKLVHEAAEVVKQVAAEEIIEAAEAIGERL